LVNGIVVLAFGADPLAEDLAYMFLFACSLVSSVFAYVGMEPMGEHWAVDGCIDIDVPIHLNPKLLCPIVVNDDTDINIWSLFVCID